MSLLANKYLIIAPAWVGDMVMAQSLFKMIKQLEPNATIDVAAPAHCLSLIDYMPEINEGILLDFGHGEFNFIGRRRLGKVLKQSSYTHSIILPNSWKSALLPFFAKVPHRRGWRGEMRYGLLNDLRKLDKQALPLMIERFCALALEKSDKLPSRLPYPRFKVSQNEVEAIKVKFEIKGNKVLALCPGAEFGPAKQWPARHYAALANEKLKEGWSVWLFGSKGDHEIAQEINALTESACLNLAGRTSLKEAVALLSLTDAVVSNDSGLMHISAALDKPLVVVYGSSSPKFTPPLSPKARAVHTDIICRPCFKRTCPLQHLNCLNELDPERVSSALNELLP